MNRWHTTCGDYWAVSSIRPADYVTGYYLDVEILFYTTNDEDFPGGELDAAGFIPDSWTQDSVPPADNFWPLVGNRISKLGVVKWESGPANGAGLAGFVYSSGQYWDKGQMAVIPPRLSLRERCPFFQHTQPQRVWKLTHDATSQITGLRSWLTADSTLEEMRTEV